MIYNNPQDPKLIDLKSQKISRKKRFHQAMILKLFFTLEYFIFDLRKSLEIIGIFTVGTTY